MTIKSKIRTIKNYPIDGVMFRDITSLLKDAEGLKEVVDEFFKRYKDLKIDKIAAIEARGFIIGAPLAYLLNIGLVLIRKPGKLPANTIEQEYQLEYGFDKIEIHTDAIKKGERVLIVDDLIATGGTAEAGAKLVEKSSGIVAGFIFVINLFDLGGKKLLENKGYKTFSLIDFPGH